MKKLISYLCLIGMLVSILAGFSVGISAQSEPAEPISVWDGTIDTDLKDRGEAGTSADTAIEIDSAAELAGLANLVNGGAFQNNVFYKLTTSIDLNDLPWTPIGKKDANAAADRVYFGGSFDGNGYCIKNLNVVATGDVNVVGLFGLKYFGYIKNLCIESGTVNVTTSIGGSICAIVDGSAQIINCCNKATVKAVNRGNAATNIGGIVGYIRHASSAITSCINYGTVDISTSSTQGGSACGGIVGNIVNITVNDCHNVGKIASSKNFTGGLVGTVHAGSVIQNCTSSATSYGYGFDGWVVGTGVAGTTYTNVTVYTSEYYEGNGKITVDGTEYTLASRMTGNPNTASYVTTVTENKTDKLKLNTAPAEDFLSATVRGSIWGAKMTGADMALDESISMRYYAEIPGSSYATKQMTFVMNDRTVTVDGVPTANTSRSEYVFVFEGIAPQNMGDNISATLVLNGNNGESNTDYTVAEYLRNVSADTTSNKLKALVADILEYGAAAQLYRDYKTDALVNTDNSGMTAFSPLAADVDKKLSASSSEVEFAAAGVNFANVNRLYYKVKAEDISGISIKIGDKSYTEFEKSGNYYVVYTDAVAPTDFNTVYTVEIQVNGATVQTLEYSVASYVYSMQNNTSDTNMATLAKALYNYGLSASAYATEQ